MGKLTELQQRVFDVLDKKPNTDVQITVLFDAAYPLTCDWTDEENPIEYPPIRDMQQKLGPLLSRINRKLKNGRIEPGVIKRTYRLNTKL